MEKCQYCGAEIVLLSDVYCCQAAAESAEAKQKVKLAEDFMRELCGAPLKEKENDHNDDGVAWGELALSMQEEVDE